MTGVVFLLVIAAIVAVVVVTQRRSKARELERKQAELAPVRKLAFEDVTALGEQLQELDLDLAGRELDAGANADYQRALDAYESSKTAVEAISEPDDVRHVTQILDDGRYAIACVRARVDRPAAADPPPAVLLRPAPRAVGRPTCRGRRPAARRATSPPAPSTPSGCSAGADPDSRMVMVGAQRVPYYQGGRAYQPYAAGYFGAFGPMEIMFAGMLFGGLGGFDMLGDGLGLDR